MSRWKLRLARFLRVKPINVLVFSIRFFYFTKIKKNIRIYSEDGHVLMHDYSQDKVLLGKPTDRILRLMQPLVVIDKLDHDKSRILSIGCRFEGDMLYLMGFGFDPKNLRGLDMISYSPWIDLGNMHKMDYPDSSWDAVILGWVLSYSDVPDVVAKEVLRITKPGGLIAIGVTYYPPELLQKFKDDGNPSIDTHVQTVQGMLDLFEGHVEHVYFHHDTSDPSRQSSCMVIFSVKK